MHAFDRLTNIGAQANLTGNSLDEARYIAPAWSVLI